MVVDDGCWLRPQAPATGGASYVRQELPVVTVVVGASPGLPRGRSRRLRRRLVAPATGGGAYVSQELPAAGAILGLPSARRRWPSQASQGEPMSDAGNPHGVPTRRGSLGRSPEQEP